MMTKKELRRQVRQTLKLLSDRERQFQSREVLSRLEQHPRFVQADTVMLFYSLPDEVFTHDFVRKWSAHKTILLPVVKGDDMEIRRYEGLDCIVEGEYHIGVPQGEPFTALSQIQLVVVPGMAFDPKGHRMGRGKGYYDKFLSRPDLRDAYKIGICFPSQLMDSIPTEPHDVLMDDVIE